MLDQFSAHFCIVFSLFFITFSMSIFASFSSSILQGKLIKKGSKNRPLGSLWAPFGSLSAHFGSLWLPLGSFLAPFRVTLAPFGSLWAPCAPFGRPFVSNWFH